MAKNNKLIRTLLIASVLINLVLLFVVFVVWNWWVPEVNVEFRRELPRFTDRQRELLFSSPPELLIDALFTYPSSYIDSVDETEEEVVVRIADMVNLRAHTAYVKGASVNGNLIVHGFGPTLVFDKEMRIKAIYKPCGDEILYKDGIPVTNSSQKATGSNQRFEPTAATPVNPVDEQRADTAHP